MSLTRRVRRSPQARAVEQARHQAPGAVHGSEQPFGLRDTEHRRHPHQALRAHDPVEPRQGLLQHLLVQEQQRGERLILRRRRDVPLGGEMTQERSDLRRPQFAGMPLAGKEDKAPDPLDVTLLRAGAVMQPPDRVSNLIEQAPPGRRRRRLLCHLPLLGQICLGVPGGVTS